MLNVLVVSCNISKLQTFALLSSYNHLLSENVKFLSNNLQFSPLTMM